MNERRWYFDLELIETNSYDKIKTGQTGNGDSADL